MSWYKIFKMAEKKSDERDYSWVSLPVPKEIGAKTMQFSKTIPERELFIQQDNEGEIIHGNGWNYGVEDDPHITILWGIHTKNVKQIEKALEGHKGGTVRLGQVGMFATDEYDVLKVNLISQSLHRLNKALQSGVKFTTSHPDYHPHLTLAYLKCGNGEKYIKDRRFQKLKFDFNEVVFEDYEDKSTTLKLEEL